MNFDLNKNINLFEDWLCLILFIIYCIEYLDINKKFNYNIFIS